jgi:hypothetical protein
LPEDVSVEGRIFEKRWSKALRRGGREAIRMPMLSSALDQIPRFMPSQVGSCVSVMAFSSMVLKIEQTVALEDGC